MQWEDVSFMLITGKISEVWYWFVFVTLSFVVVLAVCYSISSHITGIGSCYYFTLHVGVSCRVTHLFYLFDF